MQAIEFEICINKDGKIQLPEKYHDIYGRNARMVILLQDFKPDEEKQIDLMKYSNTIDWPVDGMEYQKKVRSEWE